MTRSFGPPHASLLRASATARVVGALGLSALLWLAILWAMA